MTMTMTIMNQLTLQICLDHRRSLQTQQRSRQRRGRHLRRMLQKYNEGKTLQVVTKMK
jgi:hypothetical protein